MVALSCYYESQAVSGVLEGGWGQKRGRQIGTVGTHV